MLVNREKLEKFEQIILNNARKMGYDVNICHAADLSMTDLIFLGRNRNGGAAQARVVWKESKSLTDAAVDVLVALGTGKLSGREYVSYRDYHKHNFNATIMEFCNVGYSKIRNVVFNPPATIVFWKDGTKTVVKCNENDTFDPEKGLAMAIAKKTFGDQAGYYRNIKKWTEPYYEQQRALQINIPENNLSKALNNISKALQETCGGVFVSISSDISKGEKDEK